MTDEEALDRFKQVCRDEYQNVEITRSLDGMSGYEEAESKCIDYSEELDWKDLSVGFFIGIGCTPSKAHELARIARYTHQYWGY